VTIVSRAAIERAARAAADRGDSLAQSNPYPPDSEHAHVYAEAFNEARKDVA
jgi:hypothetical protein